MEMYLYALSIILMATVTVLTVKNNQRKEAKIRKNDRE